MGFRVEYLDKNNRKALSPAFGSAALAAAYARTVKGGFVVQCDVDAPPVAVTACPSPEQVKAQREREANASLEERRAEAAFEAGSQARLLGASASEALDAAWYARGHVTTDALDPIPGTELEYVCGMCRRPVKGGFTMCRKCARA